MLPVEYELEIVRRCHCEREQEAASHRLVRQVRARANQRDDSLTARRLHIWTGWLMRLKQTVTATSY
jgi:hypothetical protein